MSEIEPTENPDEGMDEVGSAEEFKARYGFEHDCRCEQDWDTGNLAVTAECFLNMIKDALTTLAEAQKKLAEKDEEIATLRVELADQS